MSAAIPVESNSACTPTDSTTPAATSTDHTVKTKADRIQGAQHNDCKKWIEALKGDSCDTVGASVMVTAEQIKAWNTFLQNDEKCLNLWAGYDVSLSDPSFLGLELMVWCRFALGFKRRQSQGRS